MLRSSPATASLSAMVHLPATRELVELFNYPFSPKEKKHRSSEKNNYHDK